MKYFFLLAFTLTSSAFAAQYEVTSYSSCGGNCASSAYWNGVELNRISSVLLAVTDTSRVIGLKDSKGHSWTLDLNQCISSSRDLRGCQHAAKLSADQTLVSVTQWEFQSSRETLMLDFNNQSKLALYGPHGDHFVLELSKVAE